MKSIVDWVDVNPFLAKQEQPVYLIERPLPQAAQGNPKGNLFNVAQVAREGVYLTVTSDLYKPEEAGGPDWSITSTGDFVRVPMFAYRTEQKALASIWGTGLQLGLLALSDALKHCGAKPIESSILVLGHECHELENGFRCYVGLSFKLKERR